LRLISIPDLGDRSHRILEFHFRKLLGTRVQLATTELKVGMLVTHFVEKVNHRHQFWFFCAY